MSDAPLATTLDAVRVRAAFPGLDDTWAFLDNAGGTFPAAPVVARVRAQLERWPVQLGATYPRSEEAAARVAAGRAAAARLVGGAPEECVFGASSTVNAGLLARALSPRLRAGDAVVVTDADHEANVGPWRKLAGRGVEVREWRLDPTTLRLRTEDLEPLLADGRVRLVAFTHASNVLGSIEDVAGPAALARERGALTCVDGVAYAPHRRVDVAALGVDFYLISLYKLFGPHLGLPFFVLDPFFFAPPRAAAMPHRMQFLLGSLRSLARNLEELGSLESQNHFFVPEGRLPQSLEPGNPPYESLAGVAGIVEHLEDVARLAGTDGADGAEDPLEVAFDAIARHEEALVEPLLAFLRGRPDVRILGEPEADRARRVAVVSFAVEGRSSRTLVEALERASLATRYGHFYAQRLVARLGLLEPDGPRAAGVVRVSLVHSNTSDEVERLVDALANALA